MNTNDFSAPRHIVTNDRYVEILGGQMIVFTAPAVVYVVYVAQGPYARPSACCRAFFFEPEN